ncbi:MAG TPA: membrane protein insertion efficiency factor YidD [Chitinophagaceae bacterium]|nr:membrane protein insertion efficiency factor YidD [Chitinophagaceae bacterium]
MLRKVIQTIFIGLIRFYQGAISPYLGVSKCRYTPTCSEYAREAFIKYGVFKAAYLSIARILRCAPWGGHGEDPLP